MKTTSKVCLCIFIILIMVSSIQAQNDRKGSSDHPLISRMPDFWIAVYQESEYESHVFRDSSEIETEIEGHYYHINNRKLPEVLFL